jgi:hypothetical protein
MRTGRFHTSPGAPRADDLPLLLLRRASARPPLKDASSGTLRLGGDVAMPTYKVKFRQDDRVVERQIKADGMMFVFYEGPDQKVGASFKLEDIVSTEKI